MAVSLVVAANFAGLAGASIWPDRSIDRLPNLSSSKHHGDALVSPAWSEQVGWLEHNRALASTWKLQVAGQIGQPISSKHGLSSLPKRFNTLRVIAMSVAFANRLWDERGQ